MAKRFGGFTPQQQQQLLSPLGYTGPAQQDDMNKFMMSSPQAASMMGKYAEMATARVEGGPQMAMHLGGDVPLEVEPGQSLADAANNQQIAADQAMSRQDPKIAAANSAAANRLIASKGELQIAPRQVKQVDFNESGELFGFDEYFNTQYPTGYLSTQEYRKPIEFQGELRDPKQVAEYENYLLRTDPSRKEEYNAKAAMADRDRMTDPYMRMIMDQQIQRDLPRPTTLPSLQKRQNPQTGSFEVVNEQGKVVRSNLDNEQQANAYIMENQTPRKVHIPKSDIRMAQQRNEIPEFLKNYNEQEALKNYMSFYDRQRDGRAFGFQEGGVTTNEVTTDPVYDPSQGLPDPVADLYTDTGVAIDSVFDAGTFNEGTEGQNQNINSDKTWAKTTVGDLSGNTTIMQDPSNYELGTYKQGGKTYYQIQYPDGTAVKTGHRNKNFAVGRANALSAAFQAASGVVTPEEKTALEQQYQDQVGQYEQYQTGEATTASQTPVTETIKTAQNKVNVSNNLISRYNKELAGLDVNDPKRTVLEKYIADEQVKLNQSNADLTQAKDRQSAEQSQASKERTAATEADPSSGVTKADVATIDDAAKEAGKIGEGVGAAGAAAEATVTSSGGAGQATVPTAKDAATYTAEESQARVKETLDALEAATGKPSTDALAEAQTMDPEELAQLGLTAAQIEEAVQVTAPDKRVAQEGELLDVDKDVTVDMERVEKEALNFEAATGTPSSEATVQGQLTGLMADFEGGEPPAWAAGAMRAATAQMAARGLGASSMAAQAIVQAAMESALPIAMQDAQTVASFEAQNLSNRQQVAMFSAEQRAKFLGMEFDQSFQIRVQNAAKIADIANQNFSAEVQISLENARLANTVDLANLDAKNAKILSDAAAMSNVELTNLNNRQQAAVQIANAFLQFDMAEFDAKQEVAMFKAQGNIQSILSDQAAVNAAEQFNATSENQTNQFYDSLISQAQQFNVDQDNAMKKFETEQANALAMFNTEQENNRAEFEATNALLIAQADAKWEQEIALTETAATNAANNEEARAANGMTSAVYEASKQADRDTMSYSFQTANNNADRATSVSLQVMQNEASADAASASKSASFAAAAGAVIANVVKFS